MEREYLVVREALERPQSIKCVVNIDSREGDIVSNKQLSGQGEREGGWDTINGSSLPTLPDGHPLVPPGLTIEEVESLSRAYSEDTKCSPVT